ncbi:MAG: MogA/MoaB family molybdenum cofactor biosynthesis protein [Dehalococcoidia bacterium]
MAYEAGVLTVSDLGSRGERQDTAGPAVAALLDGAGFAVTRTRIVPDDQVEIVGALQDWCEEGVAVVVTTGGTGLAPRDRTPEATALVVEYQVPGIPQAMRAAFTDRIPEAMLSRGIAGVRGRTLILNLPGSEKAARENLEVALPVLVHACDLLHEDAPDVAETHRQVQGGPGDAKA